MNYILNFSFSASTFLQEFILVYLLQVGLYVVSAGGLTVFYAIWRYFNIGESVDNRPLKPNQIASEICWGLVTCAIIALILYSSLVSISDLYQQSWAEVLFFSIGFLVVYDLYIYFVHRLLHTRVLIRFHARHHKSAIATPWSSLNLHPVQAVLNYFPFLVFAMLFPVSLSVFITIHILLILSDAYGHSNYNILAGSKQFRLMQNLVCFHQQHHSSGRGNFGYLYTHWDTLFGTKLQKL